MACVRSTTAGLIVQAIDYHELKVAMRALGFDLKKAEVLKILRDHDKGHGVMDFDDFSKISPSRRSRPR